ncbi:hypothetical protein OUZ56_029385 [Daphnia magna]|uniref:Uncharacterized protein n=1 Tax=Daphnia magna TaxID=35525 RepID=A0ABR0B6N8_9CRUS|nr:hypothetical protein OUZ56_029385 [Daphnia magna]
MEYVKLQKQTCTVANWTAPAAISCHMDLPKMDEIKERNEKRLFVVVSTLKAFSDAAISFDHNIIRLYKSKDGGTVKFQSIINTSQKMIRFVSSSWY